MTTGKPNLTEALRSIDLLLKEDKSISSHARAAMELLLAVAVSQAELLQRATEQIQALSDEIAVLKGNK